MFLPNYSASYVLVGDNLDNIAAQYVANSKNVAVFL